MAISKNTQKPMKRSAIRFRRQGEAVKSATAPYDPTSYNNRDVQGQDSQSYVDVEINDSGAVVQSSAVLPRD